MTTREQSHAHAILRRLFPPLLTSGDSRMGEQIGTNGNGNGTKAFWTAAGPIVVTIALAAVGFIVAGVNNELTTQDTRIDRLEEGKTALVERLSRIEVSSQATAYDVQQIRRLLERREIEDHQ